MPLLDCPPGTTARLLELAASAAIILALTTSALLLTTGALISLAPDRILASPWVHGRLKTRILLPNERPTTRNRALALGLSTPTGLLTLHFCIALTEHLYGPHSGCPLPF